MLVSICFVLIVAEGQVFEAYIDPDNVFAPNDKFSQVISWDKKNESDPELKLLFLTW